MIKNITNILNYETTSKYNIDVMASNNITTFMEPIDIEAFNIVDTIMNNKSYATTKRYELFPNIN